MNNFKKTLNQVLNTATFRQSSLIFFATGINGLLGGLFYISVARALGPGNFGLFTVAVYALTLLSDVGDLGTNTGLVRHVGQWFKTDQQKSLRFLNLSLKIKIISGLSLVIIGLLGSEGIANLIFKKAELDFPLKLAFIGAGGLLFFSFTISVLQAIQKFWQWGALQVGTNFLRLLIVLLLWISGKITLDSVLITYICLPVGGFLISLFFLPQGFLKVKNPNSVASDLFHYNKWVAAFTILAAISARLDTFISARLLSSTQVGYYSAANSLVAVVPQFAGAFGTVIAPKMAAMKSMVEVINYLKKAQLLVLGLAFLAALAIPIVVFLIPIIYGPSYAASVPSLFIILMLAMIVFLVAIPVHNIVFYHFSNPKLFTLISLGHLIIISTVGWFLISRFGIVGAAIAVLLSNLFDFLLPLFWVLQRIKYEDLG